MEPRLGKVVRHEGEHGPADEGDNSDEILHSGADCGFESGESCYVSMV